MTARNRLHRHEPDVMAVGRVLGAGIAEADEKHMASTAVRPPYRDVRYADKAACVPPHFFSGFAGAAAAAGCSTRGRSSAGCSAWSRTGSRAFRGRHGARSSGGSSRSGSRSRSFGSSLHFFRVAGRRHHGDEVMSGLPITRIFAGSVTSSDASSD